MTRGARLTVWLAFALVCAGGVAATLYTVTVDVAVRALGGVLLVALVIQNRRADRESADSADATAAPT